MRFLLYFVAWFLFYKALILANTTTLGWSIGFLFLSYMWAARKQLPKWRASIEEASRKSRIEEFKEKCDEGKKEYEEKINGKKDNENHNG